MLSNSTKPRSLTSMRDSHMRSGPVAPATQRSAHHKPALLKRISRGLKTVVAWALLVGAWVSPSTAAPPFGYDMLHRDVALGIPTLDVAHRDALELLDHATHSTIRRAADQFTTLLQQMPDDHAELPRVQLNAAIAFAAAGDTGSALTLISVARENAGATAGLYSLKLIPYMLAEGDVFAQLDEPLAAIRSYQSAQNITHRQFGVYTPEQIPVIERVIKVAADRGTRHVVETQLRMRLRIARESLGRAEVARMQLRLAAHYKRRCDATDVKIRNDPEAPGISLRYGLGQSAAKYYQGAIESLGDTSDQEQRLYAMQNLALTWSLIDRPRASRKSARAYLAAAREAYGGRDTALARALINTGDIHMVLRDQIAFSLYAEAWGLLADDPDLRGSLLGDPVRLLPTRVETAVVNRRPESTAPDEPLAIHFAFEVMANGRPGRVNVLFSNVFAEQRRVSRSRLRKMIYRPRFENGVAAATGGIEHVQPFRVGAPDAFLPWNQRKLEAERAAQREEAAKDEAKEQ